MSEYLDEIVSQVMDWDARRERSQQKEIGWSQVAGCRAYMGYQMAGEWATDDTDWWRAIAGTALHAWLQGVRRSAMIEHERVGFEIETNYGGIPGHVDEVLWERPDVTDYKFSSLRSIGVWDDPKVLDEKFVQVQGYAAGLVDSRVYKFMTDAALTVRLLVVPVDGTFDQWRSYERPFDRDVADAAVERVTEVESAIGMDAPLPRDKPWHWCERFCEFFSMCRQPSDEPSPTNLPEITDEELAAAIEAYGLAKEMASEGKTTKDALAPSLRGLQGTARGWKITTGAPGREWKEDLAAIRADYELSGLDVPMHWVPKSGALRVTRVKG